MATSYYDATDAVNREGTIYEQDAENVLENLEDENLQNNEIVENNQDEQVNSYVSLFKLLANSYVSLFKYLC